MAEDKNDTQGIDWAKKAAEIEKYWESYRKLHEGEKETLELYKDFVFIFSRLFEVQEDLIQGHEETADAQEEVTKKVEKHNKVSEVWQKNVERMQKLMSEFSGVLRSTATLAVSEFAVRTAGLSEKAEKLGTEVQKFGTTAGIRISKDVSTLTKHIASQGTMVTRVKKHWAELTGAIIGSFYTIAKLSPLFASYISEFGGILAYVYDTAIAPWSDEIEWLLDQLWGLADWFDQAPEPLQKFVGALMIAIPILTGVVIAVISFITVLSILAGSPVVAAIATFVAGVGLGTIAVYALIAAVLLIIAYFVVTSDSFKKCVSDIINGAKEIKTNLERIFNALKIIIYGILIKYLGEDTVKAIEKAWEGIKSAVRKGVEYIKEKLMGLYDVYIRYFSPIGMVANVVTAGALGTDKIANYLEGLAGYATGGNITQDGIYRLHAGEKVIPATQASKSESEINIVVAPVINMNGSITNSHQARIAADEMSQYWLRDIRKALSGSMKS